MTITIAGIGFDHVDYDERGDVPYLNVGEPRAATYGLETKEGHGAHYDERGAVIGLTLLNVRWSLDRDGEVTLTWPRAHLFEPDLDYALSPARRAGPPPPPPPPPIPGLGRPEIAWRTGQEYKTAQCLIPGLGVPAGQRGRKRRGRHKGSRLGRRWNWT